MFVPVRCQCKYCEQCLKEAMIYDECEGCYFGKHPCLPRINCDFENHLEKIHQLWPETIREETIIKSSKLSNFKQLLRNTLQTGSESLKTKIIKHGWTDIENKTWIWFKGVLVQK